MPQHDWDDEDMDSVMSSIMQGEATYPVNRQQINNSEKIANTRPRKNGSATLAKNSQAFNRPKGKFSKTKKLSLAFILVILGVATLFGAYLTLSGPISALFTPPSPFIGKISGINYPLYYPSKLPKGFKIELNSIIQPENSTAVVYDLSNDSGKKVNIILQRKPKDIDLPLLESNLTDTRDVITKFGTVKVGLTDIGVIMGNVLTDETWIIINSDKNVLSEGDFDMLLQNLSIGKK
jgi:hypothetical protein